MFFPRRPAASPESWLALSGCSRLFARRFRPGIEVIRLAPPALLGPPLESIYWTRANAEAWIRAGEEQGAAIKHSIANCFERE